MGESLEANRTVVAPAEKEEEELKRLLAVLYDTTTLKSAGDSSQGRAEMAEKANEALVGYLKENPIDATNFVKVSFNAGFKTVEELQNLLKDFRNITNVKVAERVLETAKDMYDLDIS